MKRIILFVLSVLLLTMSNLVLAAVFTPIAGEHVFAPLDANMPLIEMTMHVENRDNGNAGHQDQSLKMRGTGWDVACLGNTGLYGGVDKRTLYYYEIVGYAYQNNVNPFTIDTFGERRAVDIRKDFSLTDPSQQPGLVDQFAIWNTQYSADAAGTPSCNYLRITKAVLKVRFFDALNNPADHVIMDKNYGADVQGAETGVLVGANFFAGETSNHLKTNVIQQANNPARLLFGVWLPRFFKFVEFSHKFGVNFTGLKCPDQIRVVFFRVPQNYVDSNTQLENIPAGDKIALTALTLIIDPVKSFHDILYSYSGPPNTLVFDAIGDQTNTPGDTLTGTKREWGHLYRIEYKFGATWRYGITRKTNDSGDTKCDDTELYFSPNQGRFRGTL